MSVCEALQMCQSSRGEDRQGDNEKYAEVLHYCTSSEVEGSEECRFPYPV